MPSDPDAVGRDEFNDGRFVALPAPPAPTGEAGEG